MINLRLGKSDGKHFYPFKYVFEFFTMINQHETVYQL